jgi:diguanylate cyclase (GGDEF)-like protein
MTVGALIAIGAVVLVILSGISDTSKAATETARAALRAAESEAELAKLQGLLQRTASDYLASPEVTGLPEQQRMALKQELSRVDEGAPGEGLDSPLAPPSRVALIALQDVAGFLNANLESFADADLNAASVATLETLDLYYVSPTPGNLRLLMVSLDRLLDMVDARAIALDAESQVREGGLVDETSGATIAVLIALGVIGAVILGLSQRIIWMVRRSIEAARIEQADLAVTTSRLQYRNDQLNALYNVFTEITDTLSLQYVVDAALRESMNIMHADMATLRILRGKKLEVAGAMVSTGQEVKNLTSVELGVGPTGRTAKRGRTMRIDEGGERLMSDQHGTQPGQSPAEQTNYSPMESGVIVPLVVGARVVGTLACWSREKHAFNDEDQRIVEMMGSQVATAIAAADATETSERRAHQDPLTALPNRRQLDQDLDGVLRNLAEQKREAVVAMVDIDYFKRLNDDHGHHAGDIALQRIAVALRNSVRDGDRLYRFGGEEFVVVFTDTAVDEAKMLAERLRSTIKAVEFTGEHGEPLDAITVSIGLALLPEHGEDVRALIDLADKAMYRAKAKGRDRVVVWSEDISIETKVDAA